MKSIIVEKAAPLWQEPVAGVSHLLSSWQHRKQGELRKRDHVIRPQVSMVSLSSGFHDVLKQHHQMGTKCSDT